MIREPEKSTWKSPIISVNEEKEWHQRGPISCNSTVTCPVWKETARRKWLKAEMRPPRAFLLLVFASLLTFSVSYENCCPPDDSVAIFGIIVHGGKWSSDLHMLIDLIIFFFEMAGSCPNFGGESTPCCGIGTCDAFCCNCDGGGCRGTKRTFQKWGYNPELTEGLDGKSQWDDGWKWIDM